MAKEKKKITVPISKRALPARLNRKLEADAAAVKITRENTPGRRTLGEFYVVEVAMLAEALEHRESVWLTATILQEVLQGADSPERFTLWDRVLGELPSINSPEAREAARSAAHLYARHRWAAVTPRSVNDCLIATHSIFACIPLLNRDRDLDLIAGVEPKLMLVPAKHG